MEQTDRPTQSKGLKRKKKKNRKKNTFTTKARSFCRNTHSPSKSHRSITQPACLSCSSGEQDNNISVFKYTQSLYRQGNHHTGKTRLYTEQGEMKSSQIKKKKKRKQIKFTPYRGSGGYYGGEETSSSEYLLIKTRPDWAMPDQRAFEAAE